MLYSCFERAVYLQQNDGWSIGANNMCVLEYRNPFFQVNTSTLLAAFGEQCTFKYSMFVECYIGRIRFYRNW